MRPSHFECSPIEHQISVCWLGVVIIITELSARFCAWNDNKARDYFWIFKINWRLLYCVPASHYNGLPMPAALKSASFSLRRLQHSAILPSTTTVGTEFIPYFFALSMPTSFRLYTLTSQLGQAIFFTRATVSSQSGQPAVNTSTVRFFDIWRILFSWTCYTLSICWRVKC